MASNDYVFVFSRRIKQQTWALGFASHRGKRLHRILLNRIIEDWFPGSTGFTSLVSAIGGRDLCLVFATATGHPGEFFFEPNLGFVSTAKRRKTYGF